RAPDGRLLNRRIGHVRTPGERDGLTRAQAERAFRRVMEEEAHAPRPVRGARVPTVDEAATSLRERLELRGTSRSYRTACEYMQRVHIKPALGERPVGEIERGEVEALARALLKKKLAPK